MSWSRKKAWRRIAAAVEGTLSGPERSALFEEVRRNETARSDYDLTFEALRELEHAAVAQGELDLVEGWLMDDLAGDAAAAAVPWWRRAWVPAGLGLLVAAALLLVMRPGTTTPPLDDGFQARGAGNTGALAIDALCPGTGGREGLVPAAEFGCALSGTVSFAYRVAARVPQGQGSLALFGVDRAGDVLYYAPTPADANAIDATRGVWTPLPMVVQLGVNHEPGPVVVYGLLSAQTPTASQIEAMAAALEPGRFADGPWHARIADDPTMQALCPQEASCESAELTFTIDETSL